MDKLYVTVIIVLFNQVGCMWYGNDQNLITEKIYNFDVNCLALCHSNKKTVHTIKHM